MVDVELFIEDNATNIIDIMWCFFRYVNKCFIIVNCLTFSVKQPVSVVKLQYKLICWCVCPAQNACGGEQQKLPISKFSFFLFRFR